MKKDINIITTLKGLVELLKKIGTVETQEKPENIFQKKRILIKGTAPVEYDIDYFILEKRQEYQEPFSISIDGEVKIDREKIKSQIKEQGIEAIAWYIPFHIYDGKYWGIYYDAEGIAYLSEELFGTITTKHLNNTIEIIRQHEIFHFNIEMMWTMLELADYCFNKDFHGHSFYKTYFEENKNREIEEALANAVLYDYALKSLQSKYVNRLEKILEELPDGYHNYTKYIPSERLKDGLNEIFFSIKPEIIPSSIRLKLYVIIFSNYGCNEIFGPIFFTHHPYLISPEDVPEYLLVDPENKWIKVGIAFPPYSGCKVEVRVKEPLEPPHIHVFIPPEKEKGKYLYPTLEPFKEENPLSNSEKKKLKEYFKIYGEKILEKIKQAFPNYPDKHKFPDFD